MLEKIKEYAKWVLLPVTLLFGFVYYLLTSNRNLKDKLARKDSELKIGKTLNELQEASKDADHAEEKFRSDLDDYERSKHDDSKS